MNAQRPSLGQFFVTTVANANLQDAVAGVAEVVLDDNLTAGLLKELPVFGTALKFARAAKAISNEMFVRKILLFLANLNETSIEDRNSLLAEYPNFSAKQRVLGENLLLALERHDHMDKPILLARFFAAYIKKEIDLTTFTRLARALDKFNMELFPNLYSFYKPQDSPAEKSEEITHELSLTGLVLAELSGSGVIGGSAGYRQSDLGILFLRLGFASDI